MRTINTGVVYFSTILGMELKIGEKFVVLTEIGKLVFFVFLTNKYLTYF